VKILRPRWLGVAAVVLAVLLAINYLRPVPAVAAALSLSRSTETGSPVTLPWAGQGQGAVGAEGAGVLAATSGATPQPIGSVAKVLTALAVLDTKPLQKGQAGPTIALGPDDAADAQQAQANMESFVPVQAGEQLTEYQALQAILLPSANNIARTLARWTDGSIDAFVRRLNAKAAALGLKQTRLTDPSGLSPQTVSVASDLVRLGDAAMQNEVIADIVSQPQATLPVAGNVYNVNYVLGQEGIVGIKTGSTTEAGACYLFAATHRLANGRPVVLLGAVMGLTTLASAMDTAKALLRTLGTSLQAVHVVSRDQRVGSYAPSWTSGTELTATQDLDVLILPGTVVRTSLVTRSIDSGLPAQARAGSLRVQTGDSVYNVPVTTVDAIDDPGPFWRLTRLTF
jgi:D-alanyl-D-alanine carboxypeptidase (penicillin-binding protein 5/6)